MNELQVVSELHKFLNKLAPMEYGVAAKSLTLSYRPITFTNRLPKFATLYGEKRYSCLILHVDPGNPDSTVGPILQQEIEKLLQFNLQELRNFKLKNHEIYIPFEIINSKEKLNIVKAFIEKQLELFIGDNW